MPNQFELQGNKKAFQINMDPLQKLEEAKKSQDVFFMWEEPLVLLQKPFLPMT